MKVTAAVRAALLIAPLAALHAADQDLRQHGAKRDGVTFDSGALQKAIAQASGCDAQSARHNVPPTAIKPEMFNELIRSSPFTRPLNQPGSTVLTGFFRVDGRPMVLVKETETGKTHLITETPNENGWKLVKVNAETNLARMSAEIAFEGGKSMEVRYDESSLNPHAGASEIKVPAGIDSRPPPTDEERKKFVESITPRFNGMSEEQKKRFGQLFGEKLKANPNLSDRQKGALLLKVLDYVAPLPK